MKKNTLKEQFKYSVLSTLLPILILCFGIVTTAHSESIRVEAESYINIDGTFVDGQPTPVSTYVTNGETALNYINRDDVIDYQITVTEPGDYSLVYSIGTAIASGSEIEFLIEQNNSFISQGKTTVPNTGWDNFQDLLAGYTVQLTAGSQTLRLRGAGTNDWQWNINAFTLTHSGGTSVIDSDNDGVNDELDQCPNTPQGDVVDNDGCTLTGATSFVLQAEDYDSAIGDVQTFNLSGGGQAINYFNSGDALNFNVNIAESASYKVTYRVATGVNNNVVAGLQANGFNGALEVKDNTSVIMQSSDAALSWDIFYDQQGSSTFNLYKGANIIRVYGAGSADFQFNIDLLTLTRVGDVDPDTDDDNVNDEFDICPNTSDAERNNVNSVGCAPSQLDSDSDSITDDLDQCPNTPITDFVDSVGCTSSGGDDDDFDGVDNHVDQCLSTSYGINVNGLGCNVNGNDSDNDGVANNLDTCGNTPAGEFANKQGCSTSQVNNNLAVDVTVTANMRHEVNGVSDFGRNRHMTMHSSIFERDWNGHTDKLNYILNTLDVYMGRDNGSSTWRFQETEEDPSRNNWANLSWMVTRGKELREEYDSIPLYKRFATAKTEMIAGTNVNPLYPTLNWNPNGSTWTGWQPKEIATSAEWVGQYLESYFSNSLNGNIGEPLPKYWEVINEPDMRMKTGAFVVTNQEQIWEYHNLVAEQIRNRLGNEAPLIGGMTWGLHDFFRRDGLSRLPDDNYSQYISIPDDPAAEAESKALYLSRMSTPVDDTRNENWYQWDVMWRGFMEAAGDNMDFYSVHIYDWPAVDATGIDVARRGGHVQAMLDMMEWYDVKKGGLANRKPIVLSEYGAVQGGWDRLPHQERYDITNLKAFNAMLMQYLERPDYVVKSMPFTPAKPLWGYQGLQDGFITVGVCGYKEVPDCVTPYHYAMLIEEQINSGDWQWSSYIKFYELWANVDGTRVDSSSTDLDVQVDSYVNGDELFVIINNLEETATTINLSVAGVGNANINNVEMRQMYFVNEQETILDRRHMKTAPNTLTLSPDATVVLRYSLKSNININQVAQEVKYFGESVSGGSVPHRISITGGEKTLNINNVSIPSGSAEATLRLTVSLFPDADDKPGGFLTIDSLKVNGTSVDTPIDWRGPAENRNERYFATLEIPVPISVLQTNNKIDVNFHHNGELTVANLTVLGFSSQPNR
ncbi:carbohydrate-binding protein [Colwellia sp. RE-S-Sl-9]